MGITSRVKYNRCGVSLCRVLLPLILIFNTLLLSGCASISYYHQALSGQWELFSKRQSLDVAMGDPAVSQKVKKKLIEARNITEFARTNLRLPVEDTFSAYVDIGRKFVVWNVFSASEFSSQLDSFCYPIAGCVTYKGFFKHQDALDFAARQQASGLDVYTGGVAAYSTLGWFADPLLNTFLHRSESELAGLIFHELAHKVVYLPGDTTFNESFATAVERYGVRQWFLQQAIRASRRVESSGELNTDYSASGQAFDSAYDQYTAASERRSSVVQLILAARSELAAVYKSNPGKAIKRQQKADIIARLRGRYLDLQTSWEQGNEFAYWMQGEINNAKIGAIGAYHGWVPAFSIMLENSIAKTGSMQLFFAEVQKLAKLPPASRQQALIALTIKQ
ncbi:MAG: aminopeptidase [Pseudomonadales bacterium]|nr:aminopeptidase [Pseudomonadales bacterium]